MPSLQKSGGLKFNGTSDYVNVGAINPTTAGTLESWVKTTATGVYQGIVGNIDYSPDRNGCILAIVPPSQVELEFADASTLNRAIFNTNVSDGKFHHIVGTWDSRLMRIYVDGVKQFEQVTTVTPSNGAFNMNIGRGQDFSSQFNGTIGATRIYNRALSPSEVQMNYQGQVVRDASLVGEWLLNATSGTVATDTSGNGNHGTLNGGQWGTQATKQKPKKNMLPSFNSGQWVKHANLVVNGDYSATLNATASFQGSTVIVPVKPNTTYSFSGLVTGGTISTGGFLEVDWIDLSGSVISGAGDIFTGVIPQTIVSPLNAVQAKIFMSCTTAGIYTFTNPQLELGSTATPFEPYQLIPDLASVKVKPKKNWFDGVLEVGDIDGATGANKVGTTSVRSVNYNLISPNVQYTLSKSVSTGIFYLIQYDVNKTLIRLTSNPTTFTSELNARYFRFVDYSNDLTSKIQLELGSTATAFEPYSLVPDLPLAPQGKAIPYRGTDFTFARPSVEPYNSLTVPMDTPRVDVNGVMVEEGTSNLYLNGGSQQNDGTLKYTNDNSDSNWYMQRNVSATGTNATMGCRLLVPTNNLVNGQTYACSALVYNPQSYPIQVHQDWCDNYDNITTFNLTTIQPFETKRIFVTGTRGTYDATYRFYDIAVQGIGNSLWIKKGSVQIEQKAYATSFTDNPLGRQAESLTFPTANVLNASAGTIEVWAYENGLDVGKYVFDADGQRLALIYSSGIGYRIYQNGAYLTTAVPKASIGLHLYIVKWDGVNFYLYLDGVKVATVTSSPVFSSITKMFLGSSNGSIGQWNNPIKSLRISNVARSDQEILDSFNKSQAYMHLPFDDSTTKLLNF